MRGVPYGFFHIGGRFGNDRRIESVRERAEIRGNPVRDRTRIVHDHLHGAFPAEVGKRLQHFRRRPEVQVRLLVEVLEHLCGEDLAEDAVLPVQEVGVARGADRPACRVPQFQDQAVQGLQVFFRTRRPVGLTQHEPVVRQGLDFQIVVEISHLLHRPAGDRLQAGVIIAAGTPVRVRDALEHFAGLAGGTHDKAGTEIRKQAAWHARRTVVEVTEV